MTKLQRNEVVKWVTLGIGIIMFLVQQIRYAFNMLSDFWTESVFAGVWLFLIIAPFTIPTIIRTFIDKFKK